METLLIVFAAIALVSAILAIWFNNRLTKTLKVLKVERNHHIMTKNRLEFFKQDYENTKRLGRIHPIRNEQREFGSNTHYNMLIVLDDSGETHTGFLFTDHDLKRPKERFYQNLTEPGIRRKIESLNLNIV